MGRQTGRPGCRTAPSRPQDIITRYKALADIERGFKVLKSEIAIGPVYYRLPKRIRAHALICFVALVFQRVMRTRLRQNPVPDVGSPEHALTILRRIQTHRVRLPGQAPITGLSVISDEQAKILGSLHVRKPTCGDPYADL